MYLFIRFRFHFGTEANFLNNQILSDYPKKLAKRFVVSPTPEHCTSETCFRCLSPCGPWTDKEDKMGKKIRGLRLCTQRDCMLPLNRDKNASINIGNNFTRLLNGMTPIARMTNEELSFHKSRLCLECSD